MAFLWAGVGSGKTNSRSGSNDQGPRNLQEGLLQIGTQAWHILVHANNNNIGAYEDDKNKHSDCITSLVEVAATSERTSNKNQQLVMLIPHVSSRITQPKERKCSKEKVSILLLYFFILFFQGISGYVSKRYRVLGEYSIGSAAVVTVHDACYVISHDKGYELLLYYLPKYTRGALYGCFL